MFFRERNDNYKINDFKYVIIDTDGGGDDCQALIALDYFIKKQNKVLLGITCSNGNALVEDVARTVLIVQEICGSKYPVFIGNDFNLAGENLKDNFFGKDGIGEKQEKYLSKLNLSRHLYDHSLVKREKPYKFIAQSAIKFKNQIAIINIGPLTNLALAYHYNNEIVNCFSNVISMSCSDTLAGLHTFYTAEFNAGLDPEAAYVIFEKFKNILLITLEAAIFSFPDILVQKLFTSSKTAKADFIRDAYEYQYKKPVPISPQVIDALTVLSLFRPQVITSGLNVRLKIHTKGERTRGSSIIDYFSPEGMKPNVYLVKQFDPNVINQEIENAYNSA